MLNETDFKNDLIHLAKKINSMGSNYHSVNKKYYKKQYNFNNKSYKEILTYINSHINTNLNNKQNETYKYLTLFDKLIIQKTNNNYHRLVLISSNNKNNEDFYTTGYLSNNKIKSHNIMTDEVFLTSKTTGLSLHSNNFLEHIMTNPLGHLIGHITCMDMYSNLKSIKFKFIKLISNKTFKNNSQQILKIILLVELINENTLPENNHLLIYGHDEHDREEKLSIHNENDLKNDEFIATGCLLNNNLIITKNENHELNNNNKNNVSYNTLDIDLNQNNEFKNILLRCLIGGGSFAAYAFGSTVAEVAEGIELGEVVAGETEANQATEAINLTSQSLRSTNSTINVIENPLFTTQEETFALDAATDAAEDDAEEDVGNDINNTFIRDQLSVLTKTKVAFVGLVGFNSEFLKKIYDKLGTLPSLAIATIFTAAVFEQKFLAQLILFGIATLSKVASNWWFSSPFASSKIIFSPEFISTVLESILLTHNDYQTWINDSRTVYSTYPKDKPSYIDSYINSITLPDDSKKLFKEKLNSIEIDFKDLNENVMKWFKILKTINKRISIGYKPLVLTINDIKKLINDTKITTIENNLKYINAVIIINNNDTFKSYIKLSRNLLNNFKHLQKHLTEIYNRIYYNEENFNKISKSVKNQMLISEDGSSIQYVGEDDASLSIDTSSIIQKYDKKNVKVVKLSKQHVLLLVIFSKKQRILKTTEMYNVHKTKMLVKKAKIDNNLSINNISINNINHITGNEYQKNRNLTAQKIPEDSQDIISNYYDNEEKIPLKSLNNMS
jgi:hypothetical protein